MKLLLILLMLGMVVLLVAAFVRRGSKPTNPKSMVHVPAVAKSNAETAQCDSATDCGDAS